MDFSQIMAKLGRTGQVFVAGALLMFIDSFLPWYSVSISGGDGFPGFSGSTSGWNSGIGAWFPVILLVAVGVLAFLVAMGTVAWSPLMLVTLGTLASIVATIIILLRWVTYPSAPALSGISAGAGYGTYIGLVVAIAMAVFGYLGFTAAGGQINNIPGALKGQQPPAPPQM